MGEKAVIYSKQTGEPPIPVTVRIEWFSDGIIKPLLYWMPDGSCYKVTNVKGMIPLAFLKNRGKGIRFEVSAEVTETPETYSTLLFTRHETYIYLADNWFCGKNIIDERYSHKGKEFIPVTLDVFPNCDYKLVYFWVNEIRYVVEKTVSVVPHGSFQAGGVGVRHNVKARQVGIDDNDDPNPLKSINRMASIYFELNKWFVTIKAPGAVRLDRGQKTGLF